MLLGRSTAKLRFVHQRVAHLLAVCCALAICPVALAQPPYLTGSRELPSPQTGVPETPSPTSPVPLTEALDVRGDLSLQDASIQKALITIGASWRVNIVVGKDVQGTVSCIYKQTPLREVLDAILLANGYSYRAVGESLVVQRAQEVGSAHPLFESAAITITHSDVQEVVEGARLLLSTQGQIRALESARSIVVVDFADRVATIKAFVARMDASTSQSNGGIPAGSSNRLQVAYFHTQYIPVDNAKEPVNAVLSQLGRVATMPAENRLVVVDYASNIEMVRKVLIKIDRPVPQVRITALIYDISLEDIEQLGFNWNHTAKGNTFDANGDPNQIFSLDSLTQVPYGPTKPGSNMLVRSLSNNFDINVVGVFLQNANDARLLANPNVTVMENETAQMSSVQQIPFQQITQSELGGQIGTTSFKDVGITLHVTPSVAADGTVKMIVQQEFSRVSGFTANDNQPIIDTRIANTTVRVTNRQTLVIGGLRQRSDTGEFNGVPCLKDLYVIGPLFRSRDTLVRESELVVFLMPEIVNYDEIASRREYMAQETVNCRLDEVPVAEGCPGSGPGQPGCSGPNSASADYYRLKQLPSVDPQQSFVPQQHTQAAPAGNPLKKQDALRQNFGERYRSGTGKPTGQPRAAASDKSGPKGKKAKSTLWAKLKGSKRS